ncbi:MAG: hypothetical protein OYH77_03830 [Pseudomonadota bacterium]|nr:hypothetical protein [Pseudomonadota bacterium]
MRSFALIKLLTVSLILGVAACKPLHRQEHTSEARVISGASLNKLKRLIKAIIPDDTRSGEKLYRMATRLLSDEQFSAMVMLSNAQLKAIRKLDNILGVRYLDDEQLEAISRLDDRQVDVIHILIELKSFD